MSSESDISLSRGLPETVLPAPPPAWTAELNVALEAPPEQRRDAVARVAADHPTMLQAWGHLSVLARDPIESYAYARVGYHRGLDALRGSGWHGTGYVRWANETNQGFLMSLDALRLAAKEIGETEESERCTVFLRQLDPNWHPRDSSDA